jgi:hypothetical protein
MYVTLTSSFPGKPVEFYFAKKIMQNVSFIATNMGLHQHIALVIVGFRSDT